MKHTPGPWKVGPINYADVYGSDGNLVALIPKGFECTGGDAQLIAAAPDLLEALQSLPLDAFDKPMEEMDAADFVDNSAAFMDAMELARAALAKAAPVDRQKASTDTDVDEQHKEESRSRAAMEAEDCF